MNSHRPTAGRHRAGLIATVVSILAFLALYQTLLASQWRRVANTAQHAADLDTLTNLPNRRVLERHLDKPTHGRSVEQPAMIAIVDVDQFKPINDTYGHAVGDQVLSALARTLRIQMAGHGLATRLGGDEFALLWWNIPDDPTAPDLGAVGVEDQFQRASAEAGRILQAIGATSVEVGGSTIIPEASIGMAIASAHLHGWDLLRAADSAMYQAKKSPRRVRSGRSTVCIHGAARVYQGPTPIDRRDGSRSRRSPRHRR